MHTYPLATNITGPILDLVEKRIKALNISNRSQYLKRLVYADLGIPTDIAPPVPQDMEQVIRDIVQQELKRNPPQPIYLKGGA